MVCDTHAQTLRQMGELYPEIELTQEAKALIHHPRLSGVAIVTGAASHYSLAREALLAGKDIYVEKPLCLSLKEGQELVQLAHEKGRILMVGHILQYHPHVQKLQELFALGELGNLRYLAAHRLNLGKICDVESALWSYAPHDISVILSLCGGQLPQQVRCTGGAYLKSHIADTTLTTLTFESKVAAHIYTSWLNPFKEQKLTVVGSRAMAVFDDTLPWESKLSLYRDPLQWTLEENPIPNPDRLIEQFQLPHKEPLREELQHFLDCCLYRKAPLTGSVEALAVMAVLQAAQQSLQEEGAVKYLGKQLGKHPGLLSSSAVI
jgi:UDP-2-acetamido-3-amino-2,3-dideoxy-glucuronate N-acetyltransferase